MLSDPHRRHTFSDVQTPQALVDLAQLHGVANGAYRPPRTYSPPAPSRSLPAYVKPLPARIGADEVIYLSKKDALTIPPPAVRNALLQCFIEFVYPYMPLLDLHHLIDCVDKNDGRNQVSLLVFQAIMFSGAAAVDMKYIKEAGFLTRRDARREFFARARLLYDFDYEMDRISLIQALLLMTYWYETPDDQKDSHHWMGIAVSLSHTIGLHRNPARSNMDEKRQKLWKRMWWSTYMRDRLIALGMRRPTRIKDEDYDVPLLTLEDFDISALDNHHSVIPAGCTYMRDTDKQRKLAIMCLEKAKLCICISHVLSTQYSVLHNNHGVQSKEGSTRTTMMLVARKDDPEVCGVRSCDEELHKWKDSIAPEADYITPAPPIKSGDECLVVNRSLLHMVYHAALSALHRPQVLPSTAWPQKDTGKDLLDISRRNVRFAANQITSIAEALSRMNMVRFLPTVGITVLLPAIIIHLLDIKAPDEPTRRVSLQGFCQCMQILSKLRDIYAAADYSTAFLEAAIKKAEIALPNKANEVKDAMVAVSAQGILQEDQALRHQEPFKTNGIDQDLHNQNIDPALASVGSGQMHLTPPPESNGGNPHITFPNMQMFNGQRMTDADIARRLNSFLGATPPDSNGDNLMNGHLNPNMLTNFNNLGRRSGTTTPRLGTTTPRIGNGTGLPVGNLFDMVDFEPDFDALVNLDAAGEAFALDDAAFALSTDGMGGSGFMSSDVDWLSGLEAQLQEQEQQPQVQAQKENDATKDEVQTDGEMQVDGMTSTAEPSVDGDTKMELEIDGHESALDEIQDRHMDEGIPA